MPAHLFKFADRTLRFDARPDRVDFRDREYQPRLANLPEQYPSAEFIRQHLATYTANFILDQGKEGACTGFAELPYEEWVRSASDAWVTVLGAPMQVASAGRSISFQTPAERTAAGPKAENGDAISTAVSAVPRLSEESAYEHTVVLGNNGRPLLRLLDTEHPEVNLEEVVHNRALESLKKLRRPKLAIYAHGGLNREAASIKRIRVLAPYLIRNDIHPLFLTWKTGVKETLVSIFEDAKEKVFVGPQAEGRFGDLGDRLKDWAGRARDRSVEAFARHFLVKSIWSEMKENARLARKARGGLKLIGEELGKLEVEIPGLEIHLIGHSAGAILLGHLIDELRRREMKVSSTTLFAPACTLKFAVDHFGKALEAGTLPSVVCHNMDDERERNDSVWKYGKSLLYLVSRALEEVHKMPLLGMEKAWDPASVEDDLWYSSHTRYLERWATFADRVWMTTYGRADDPVDTGPTKIPLAHGSFDNDVHVMSKTIQSIRGTALRTAIDNLNY